MASGESVVIGDDAADAVARAAEILLDYLADAASRRPRTFLALSGGRTPEPLYQSLTRTPLRDRFDSSRVEWFFSDERCVPPDHPDSNFGLAWRTLLEPLQVPAGNIHRMPADAPDLHAAAGQYEKTIRRRVPADDRGGLPVFDLILLGLGADGHTASLFPGSPAVHERDRLVVAYHVAPLDTWRMTMTYPLLWAARQLLVLATGPEKAEAVAAALAPASDPVRCPAAGLRRGSSLITWVLDRDTARLVRPRPTA